MNRNFTLLVLLALLHAACVPPAVAQPVATLNLETCQQLALQNYPLSADAATIAAVGKSQHESTAKSYLPQFSVNGQATYQSDVTEVPSAPLQTIEPLDKDQYKIYGELTQVLYDGGIIRQQQQLSDAAVKVETSKLQVDLYQLRQRINQLYFGILLTRAQLEQVEITKKDIRAGINRAQAAIDNGIALKSSLDVLNAERLRLHQSEIELNSNLDAQLQILGAYIHQTVDRNTLLEIPAEAATSESINRPELALFEAQDQSLETQLNMLHSKNRPRIGLFLQGGYGKPGLNMLLNEFDTYYIGGIRLQWNLAGFYSASADKTVIALNRDRARVARENFLFNTSIAQKQQHAEISKLKAISETDDEIIALRENIRLTAEAQLENGVITSTDYLREANALDQARQSKITHTIQYLMALANHKYITGN